MAGRKEITARWTVTADLALLTAAQIGGRESDYCDSTFARTADGLPFLAGASLAGALRSALSDTLAGYRQPEPPDAVELFGDAERHESPLIVFDSVGDASDAAIRDGVRIDPAFGTAQDGFKYDREVLLPGCRFPLRFDLVVDNGANESALLSCLIVALERLASGDVNLGARKSRGLGRVGCSSFRAIRYDLTAATGWRSYAQSAHSLAPLTPHVAARDEPAQAILDAYDTLTLAGGTDSRDRLSVTLNLKLAAPLIIRSPGASATDPDNIHLTEKGRALLSGTSVAGALRSQAMRIVGTLGIGTELVDDLFGSAPWNSDGRADKDNPVGSRIRVSEAFIEGSRSYEQTRVRIDRFTGGTIDGALFTEAPVVGGEVIVKLEVRNPKRRDLALVTHLCRDIIDGLVTFGGEASAGRGLLTGTATLEKPGAGWAVRVADGVVECDRPEELSASLAALVNGKDDAL